MNGHRAFFVGLGLAAALLAVHALSLGYVSDDAFISFRYARNLLAGHGLVYNPGERVEGYTNFLWTVLLAGVDGILPGERLPAIATVLGVLFGCATVVLVGFLGRELSGEGSKALLAPFLLAGDSSFAVWSTGGLETTLFAFLATAGAHAFVLAGRGKARGWFAPALFALATLARPEGALFFAVGGIFELRRAGFARAVRFAGPFTAIVGPWFLWRFAYYGWPLPNTFYAKVGGGTEAWIRGVRYLGRFLATHAWFVFALALLGLLKRAGSPRTPFLFALVAAYAGFVVVVGGDGLFQYRFCAHAVPLLYLVVQEGLWRLDPRLAPRLAWFVLVAGTLLNAKSTIQVLFLPESVRWNEPKSEVAFPGRSEQEGEHGYRFFDVYFVERQRIAAAWLEANATAGAVIASTPAGAIAYYSSHPVIDMLGLADEHIAHVSTVGMGRDRPGHEKGDGAYVLSRKPEYILLGNVAVLARPLSEEEMPSKLVRRSEEEIWADPGFHRDYERVAVETGEGGLFAWFTFWRRRADAGR